jgi:hypothetical protein
MTTRHIALSLTLLAVACPSVQLSAADAPPDTGPTLSGFVDTTYNWNTNGADVNHTHSFDAKANTFALNDGQLEVTGHPKGDSNITYMFKLDYGTDAAVLSGADASETTSNVTVEEAWGSYMDPKSKLGLKVGKFVTFEGIEVIESGANPTITRGLLFSLAEPYTTTGALITYNPNDKWDAEFGLVNGWDLISDNNQSKTIDAHLGYNGGDPLTLGLSLLYGPETAQGAPLPAGTSADSQNRLSIDLTGLTKVVKNLDINFQANLGTQKKASLVHTGSNGKWFGLGVQPVYHVNDKFSVGGRLEWLDDKDGDLTGQTSATREITISIAPAYQVTSHFLARVEGRYDSSNQELFTSKTSQTAATKKNQGELAAETIFSF